MSEYYLRDGTLVTDTVAWAKKHADPEYKRVAETKLPSGVWVSTVWLGLDHSFMKGPPLIFKTMVFPPNSWTELECRRYSTEAEAVAGHKEVVERWSAHE